MGLMITDDGVDDDSDAVSGNNDYNSIEGCHYTDAWNHPSQVNYYIFSWDTPKFYSSDAFPL